METFFSVLLVIVLVVGGLFKLLEKPLWEMFQQKNAQTVLNNRLENAKQVWEERYSQLGIKDKNACTIYKKYSNAYDFYEVLCWNESPDEICIFYAKPTDRTSHFEAFQYPENLNIIKYPVFQYYRTGSQGAITHTDYSQAQGLRDMSDHTTGLKSLSYAMKAAEAAKNAPTHTEITDDRRTVLQLTDGRKVEFRLDAFDTFCRLIPDKCRQ